MRLSDVRDDEVKQVLDMYSDARRFSDINSIVDFCDQYLDRCECCAEIVYYDTLQDTKMWDGETMKCCEKCVKEVEKDNNNIYYGVDDSDFYYEETILGLR